jgi:prepilin-type N-terminal cleavage/methylation domain-containing protein
MKSNNSKGFTLIELLVVVAIIGILSSIILVSLNSARAKGRDASAKGSISSMRATAEIYFDTHNHYGDTGILSGDIGTGGTQVGTPLGAASSICEYEDIIRLANAVFNQTQNLVHCEVVFGAGGGTSYTLEAALNDQRVYCVDSVGFSGYVADPSVGSATPGVSCL